MCMLKRHKKTTFIHFAFFFIGLKRKQEFKEGTTPFRPQSIPRRMLRLLLRVIITYYNMYYIYYTLTTLLQLLLLLVQVQGEEGCGAAERHLAEEGFASPQSRM